MFVLVQEESAADLQERVSWHLERGYQLHGDMFYVEQTTNMNTKVHWFCQAVVRHEEIAFRRSPSLNRDGGEG